MTQEIIALTIVFGAAAYAVYSIIKTLLVKSGGSCGDSCKCNAKEDIRAMLKESTKPPKNVTIDPYVKAK